MMLRLVATLALFLAASGKSDLEVRTGRALLSGKASDCSGYADECKSDDDCCGCLECHNDYCGKPCVREGGYCDDYNECCEVRGPVCAGVVVFSIM